MHYPTHPIIAMCPSSHISLIIREQITKIFIIKFNLSSFYFLLLLLLLLLFSARILNSLNS